MHTILYIGKHYISENKFVKEQGLGALENFKKIGITGGGDATLIGREKGLSRTKSPVKWIALRAWNIVGIDAEKIEKLVLHNLLDPLRVEGEWFFDEDGSLIRRVEKTLEALSLISGFSFSKIDLNRDDDEESKEVRKTDESISEMVSSIKDIMEEKTGDKVYASSAGGNAYSVSYTHFEGRKMKLVGLAPKDGTISFKFGINKIQDAENSDFVRNVAEKFVEEFDEYSLEKSGANYKFTIKTLEEFSTFFSKVLEFIEKQ